MVTNINSYDGVADEAKPRYGILSTANVGRFQYTGQAWLPELGLYHYKARVYSPTLGRFLQTDPIGYGDGMNMYAYVGNDPVNWRDPTGMNGADDIVVEAERKRVEFIGAPVAGFSPGSLNVGPLIPPIDDGRAFDDESSQSVCTAQLSGTANRGQTVNSRRAQVCVEVDRAVDIARRTGGSLGAARSAEIGRNISRLTPNVGMWIRGGTS